jgi:hypothetical protein
MSCLIKLNTVLTYSTTKHLPARTLRNRVDKTSTGMMTIYNGVTRFPLTTIQGIHVSPLQYGSLSCLRKDISVECQVRGSASQMSVRAGHAISRNCSGR